jgi:ABC-2 type transport system permease protein
VLDQPEQDAATASRAAGEAQVYRRQYTRYTGVREGRPRSYQSMISHSIKRALGIRRKWTAKIIPIILYAAAFIPVIGFVSIPAIFGTDLIQFESVDIFQALSLVLLVFAAAASPEMLCDDRRENVLQLYYSRGFSRWDYLLAKLLSLGGLMLSIALLPPLILFLGNTFLQDHPFDYLGSNWDEFLRIGGAAITLSIYFAAVGLAVSAITERKGVASAIYIGFFIAGSAILGALYSAIDQEWNSIFVLFSPLEIPDGLLMLFFDAETPGSLAVDAGVEPALYLVSVSIFAAVSAVILYRRYLRED